MKRRRIRLIDWNLDLIDKRAEKLTAAGYDVAHDALDPTAWREMRANPPEAILIDLSRAPSLGRDMALAIRKSSATKYVPLIFVEGEPSRVAGIKKAIPDAVFTSWGKVRSALKQAVNRPVIFPSTFPTAGKTSSRKTPLPKRLGFKKDIVVAMSGAPRGFELTLGILPDGVRMKRSVQGENDLLLWFTKTRIELEKRSVKMVETAGEEGLWVIFPKKSSSIPTDLTSAMVVKTLTAAGARKVKAGIVDKTWSGVRFARKKQRKSKTA